MYVAYRDKLGRIRPNSGQKNYINMYVLYRDKLGRIWPNSGQKESQEKFFYQYV